MVCRWLAPSSAGIGYLALKGFSLLRLFPKCVDICMVARHYGNFFTRFSIEYLGRLGEQLLEDCAGRFQVAMVDKLESAVVYGVDSGGGELAGVTTRQGSRVGKIQGLVSPIRVYELR